MPAFLAQSDLSRGDLRLSLRNENGYLQDAFSVLWTILSSAGVPVSGRRLPAIKDGVGEYYAPWAAKAVNGNYQIVWDVESDSGSPVETFKEKFFVVEPSAYQCHPNFVCDNGQPRPGGFAYLTGSLLGRGDLPLFLSGPNGATDAFAVFWTVLNAVGCPITSRMQATKAPGTGEYFAEWFVNVLGGDYFIQWDWIEAQGLPVETRRMAFSVISPSFLVFFSRGSCTSTSTSCSSLDPGSCASCSFPLFQTIIINKFISSGGGSCGPSFQSTCYGPSFPIPVAPPAPSPQPSRCCPFELPRVVHLGGQALPAGGAFTEQPPFAIPTQIRRITFYIAYTRGIAGGYGLFRLLWGNGTDETQSTLIDLDFTTLSSVAASQDMFLSDLKGPVPANDNPIYFTLETAIPGGATTVRLLAAEGGIVGAPGTASISLTASS